MATAKRGSLTELHFRRAPRRIVMKSGPTRPILLACSKDASKATATYSLGRHRKNERWLTLRYLAHASERGRAA